MSGVRKDLDTMRSNTTATFRGFLAAFTAGISALALTSFAHATDDAARTPNSDGGPAVGGVVAKRVGPRRPLFATRGSA